MLDYRSGVVRAGFIGAVNDRGTTGQGPSSTLVKTHPARATETNSDAI